MASHDNQQNEPRAGGDRATWRALAYLCRSVPGFRERSATDRVAYLQGLGLSADVAQEVTVLFGRLFEGIRARFGDVLLPEEPCLHGWRPNVRTPVFHGYQHIATPGAEIPFIQTSALGSTTPAEIPTPMRVFYPTVAGTPKDAPLLYDCGRYPLVVFLHGQCPAAAEEHYRHWYHLPQQLARSGYVVVVPRLGLTRPFIERDLELAERVVAWMREEWQHRDQLAPPPATGIVGHSYGGLLAGRLATRIAASAFVSLSGEWVESTQLPSPHPLGELNVPVLFTWGTGEDRDSNLDGPNASLFDIVKPPKHKIVFEGANHFDYLPTNYQSQCGQGAAGPCDLVPLLAADFTALFLSRYMPPPRSVVRIAPSLQFVDPVELTPAQVCFAGSHLVGLTALCGSPDCAVTHSWFLEGGETGTLSVPPK